MTETEFKDLATALATHIIMEMKQEYEVTESGNIIGEDYTDIDAYLQECIDEWDYINMDKLKNMKEGPFQPDGRYVMKQTIYKILKVYADNEMTSATSIKKMPDDKIDFNHFTYELDKFIEKGGTFYQKLNDAISN